MSENLEEKSRQLTEAMTAVQRDLDLYSQITRETAAQKKDAEMKAKYGIENFTKGTKTAGEAILSLGDAGFAAGKAMLEGKKGAAAFNGALDSMSKSAEMAGAALALLVPGGPLIKGLIAGLTLATTGFIKYTQAANEMADKLYTGYRGMARTGAAAADGMRGLKDGAQKLGFTMDELNDYVQLVTDNSQDLAAFGGAVYKGRQQFEDIGKAMEPAQKGLLAIGLMPKDIAEGTAGYLRTQTRLGNAQKMTVDQLADGARKYLIEQDALTKLTGVNRQEAEKMREAAMMEEQHAGMIRKLMDEGKTAELENVMKISDAANRLDPEFGKMIRGAQTMNLSSEAAQKLLMSVPGIFDILAKGQKGMLTDMQVMDQIAAQMKKSGTAASAGLAILGANNDTYVDMGIQNKILYKTSKSLAEGLGDATQQALAQGAKSGQAQDDLVNGQTKLIQTQIAANKALTDFIAEGIPQAQVAMEKLAGATLAAAKVLYGFASDKSDTKKNTDEMKDRGLVNRNLTNDQGMDFSAGSFATGGIADGPTSGYLATLHGREAIVPMDQLGIGKKEGGLEKLIKTDNSDSIEKSSKEIVIDTKTLEKLTDTNVKKAEEYNLFYKNYVNTMTESMQKQMELVKGAGTSANVNGSVGAPSMGGGLQMPSAMNMPSMGGGQGMQIGSQDDLRKMGLNIKAGDVQAQGSKISPKIIELARAIQAGVPGFNYFSSFNDKFHQENAPSSQHSQGLAVDFTVGGVPSIEDGKAITSWLKQMGASVAIDEYNSPTAKATGGHFHAQIPAFADGGQLASGKVGLVGEAGPELITGPASISPMKDLMGAFSNMGALMKQQVDMLDELVRAQKNGNDISNKMLRMQT